MRRILCWMGWHRYRNTSDGNVHGARCTRCEEWAGGPWLGDVEALTALLDATEAFIKYPVPRQGRELKELIAKLRRIK